MSRYKLQIILLFFTTVAIMIGCAAAEDERIEGPFEYREIYLPRITDDADYLKKLHLNDVNVDWGIWGHNIGLVVPKKHSESIYAKRNGLTSHEQFCFSSDDLFKYICDYIDDNFGHDHTNRFAIIPNDNSIVCQCSKCKAAGNTATDASPAVFNMISRLAEKYPMHMFFASDYATAESLPKENLPKNAGVLISAMDFPLSPNRTPQEEEFENLIRQWKEKTERIYIWDYINNFDDYFTPFPIFNVMQHRLKMYEKEGVKGVFLNGSGTDFSSMHRLKTLVLAEMLINPEIDWRSILTKKAKELYPVTGERLAQFMLAQEDYVASNGKPLGLYEGVSKAVLTYLPENEFSSFYKDFKNLYAQASEKEQSMLSDLNHALDFTQLELMRINNNLSDYKTIANNLAKIKDDKINFYNESCWTVEAYLKDYNFMANHASEIKGKNLLQGVKLKALTPLDEDYSDTSVLTDGLLGLSSNYHCGHLISSADPALKIEIPNVNGMKRLRVAMTRNLAYHIALPEKVRLSTIAGHKIGEVVPERLSGHPGQSFVEFNIPDGISGPYELTIIRNPTVKTMSIDEIEAF